MNFKLIAECCQNHNGDFDVLRRMIDSAAENGATHIKIQSIFAEKLSFRPQFENGLTSRDGKILCIKRPFNLEFERLKKLDLSWDMHKKFFEYCNEIGVVPLTTCFTHDTLNKIIEIGFKEIKIASYDCASHELIKRLIGKFNHIYISTGATFDDEIKKTAQILSGESYSLLHCVTIYPLAPKNANLARILWLKKFSKKVGYSDHSDFAHDGLVNALSSIYFGAEIIECHFTILDRTDSKDGRVSVTGDQLKIIKEFSNFSKQDQIDYLNKNYPTWESTYGLPQRNLIEDELLNRFYYRGRFCSPRENYNVDEFQTGIMNWEKW